LNTSGRNSIFRTHVRRIAAVVLVVALAMLARIPPLSAPDRAALSARFRFTHLALPALEAGAPRTIRPVHPSLRRFSAWISSVGAAVALHDLDGDGLPNDFACVDPRTDEVEVGCVPGTPTRYAEFALNPAPLTVDRATMAPMGCLPGDFNEDGLTDLLVYYWGRSPIVFLRRPDAVGTAWSMRADAFTPCEAAPGHERWFTNAATLADIDGDGHLDLYVGNYFQDGAHILDAAGTGDEAMQHSMSRATNGGHDHILLGTGCAAPGDEATPFREFRTGLDAKVADGWTLAVGAADLDGDLLPEIYLGNDFGNDRLLANHSHAGAVSFVSVHGRKGFTTPNSKVLGRDSFKGMGVDFGDVDGDGKLDIFVSNISNQFALLESHFMFMSTGEPAMLAAGLAPFTDQSEALGLSRSGWGWDCRLDDFDNDGSLEVVQATGFLRGNNSRWPELQELAMGNDDLISSPRVWPRFGPDDDLSGHQLNAFFVRGRDGRFHDIAASVGLDERQVARGLATADVDGDGDLDLAIANQWAPSSFYRNDSPGGHAFLGLHLLLPPRGAESRLPFAVRAGHPEPYAPQRPAIGAEARIVLPDGSVRVAQVDGGNGHSGKRSPDLHFGLGQLAAGTELPVTLRWRDGEGRVHARTLPLTPGWHTVMLGDEPAVAGPR
jgi:hypothetical protein